MAHCSRLATVLDQEMIEVTRQVRICSRITRDEDLPRKTGQDVALELGCRYLLRYVMSHQVGEFTGGSAVKHWVTPTPVCTGGDGSVAVSPQPRRQPVACNAAGPGKDPVDTGPPLGRLGDGIEYILPDGFPREAVVGGWEMEVQ